MEPQPAEVFCCQPERVPVSELSGQQRREPLPTIAAAPACLATAPAEVPCPVCPHLASVYEAYRNAAYYKSLHQRALEREKELRLEVDRLKAQLRLREQQLFGKKSEAAAGRSADSTASATSASASPTRRRGQQRGEPGPKRRDYSHLPAVEAVLDLPEEQKCCSHCQLPFAPFPGTEDSEVLEVEVKAYRRVIRRRRYRPTCSCGQHPGIISAPPAPRVIPKSILGVSIWVEVLLDKFLYYRPTYRLLAEWQTLGLDLSLGTLTDGLQRLTPLFKPVYAKLSEHNQQQKHWHADETRWLVFATVEGKVGYRWTLWVFHSADVVVFVLDSGRAHDVPEKHLGPVAEGILSVDRYAAYKAMKPVKEGKILLAFCWAHVRRDFLEAARSWPEQQEWALGWVGRIGQLYQANEARLQTLPSKPAEHSAADAQLRQQVEEMAEQLKRERAEPQMPSARRSVLDSLQEHWEGLTVFVEHPEVPMDNNKAERAERGPVVLRKNSYGSGAAWAGEMAAMMFSLLQTLCLWNINPRVWLEAYLQACARAGGRAPAELDEFLPWKMAGEKRKAWSLERDKEGEDSS
jgi:transposase